MIDDKQEEVTGRPRADLGTCELIVVNLEFSFHKRLVLLTFGNMRWISTDFFAFFYNNTDKQCHATPGKDTE